MANRVVIIVCTRLIAVLSTIYFLEFKKFNLLLSTILKFLEELGKFSSLVSTI